MGDDSFNRVISTIKQQFNNPLPGENAQFKMAPIGRKLRDEALAKAKNIKQSAVLALLFPVANQIKIVLMVRNNYPGVHANQISFPGGKKEPSDSSFQQTALRETEEEIGLNQNHIQIVGKLTEVFIPPSGYLVHPFVGFVDYTPNFIPEKKEVKELLLPSITEFFKPHTKTTGTFLSGITGVKINAPCYQIKNYKVWGATAMMLAEFLDLIKPIHSIIKTENT